MLGVILHYRIPRVVLGESITFRGDEERLRDRGAAAAVLQDTRFMQMM